VRTKLKPVDVLHLPAILHGNHIHALGSGTSFSTILWDYVSANMQRSSVWPRVTESVHPEKPRRLHHAW